MCDIGVKLLEFFYTFLIREMNNNPYRGIQIEEERYRLYQGNLKKINIESKLC